MQPILALMLLSTAQPMPTWFPGDWEPYSNAFQGLGMLTARQGSLDWSECKAAHFDVVEASGNTLVIRLAKQSMCNLGDQPRTRMDTVRFTLRENGCDLGVSIYSSPDAMKRNEPSAEGLYGKTKCASGPAATAPVVMPAGKH
ncbi:hypothetical protein KPL74_03990 [Bacillus sp. NP157]|nr:hypothetical protein KPL74_03990 [Bacillus sp. NP157]